MSRILVTGSTDGIGLETARWLLDAGHDVVGHARDESRASNLRDALPGLDSVVTGDLSSLAETRALAEAAAGAGPFDVVVHNAGIGGGAPSRVETVDGLEQIFQVNTAGSLRAHGPPAAPRQAGVSHLGLRGAGARPPRRPAVDQPPVGRHAGVLGLRAYDGSCRSRSRGCGRTRGHHR